MARQIGVSQAQAQSMSGTPTGQYTLQLETVGDPMDNKYNPKIPRCRFEFTVLDFEPDSYPSEEDFDNLDDYEKEFAWATRAAEEMIGKTVRFTYSMSLSNRGNLYPVYKALYGKAPAEDHVPDIDLIEGKKIIATVELVTPPNGGEARPQIIAAKPYRTGPSRAPKLQSAPDGQADEESVDDVPF